MTRKTLALLAALVTAAAVDDAAAQSLWQKGRKRHVALVADNRAHRIGDIVTIVIDERQRVENKENVKTDKTTGANASVSSFTPDPDLPADWLPVEYQSNRTFDGQADFKKEGMFETRITASVLDVQPNGNLVIEGRRKVVIDGEQKWMTISGVVRSFDVETDNTVASELVADASVSYESAGTLSASTEKGWLETFFDWVWPF